MVGQDIGNLEFKRAKVRAEMSGDADCERARERGSAMSQRERGNGWEVVEHFDEQVDVKKAEVEGVQR